MTAVNLIAFYKALPKEEQYKFMELTKEITKPKKINLPKKKKKPVLTDEEALRYLTTVVFK